MDSSNKLAIAIRGAYKTYDTKNFVLKGLNMNVREGSIYGLLGSSGCGKSTLLNSVVGLVGLDSGTIELSVKSKRDIGYMPQTVCLYEQLTIGELLNYFATMYGMSNRKKQTRMDLIFDVLDLPDKYKCIPQLSGGQKRRVSLAIALIHDPELLILDEPTVGLDPILRHRIWEFLLNWCKDGSKTVIITTHYIEETKQAHTVGLMREGIMLCEKSPLIIMEKHNTQCLEDAFLKLCLRQSYEQPATITPVRSKELTYSPITFTNETFTRSRFAAEIKKNVIYLWRNLSVTLFIFGLPSICILLFYFVYGREPNDMSLAVVNEDTSYCGNYSYQPNVCDLSYLSCNYLLHLRNKKISLVDYKEVATALAGIKNGDIRGVLHFSTHFTSALSIRLTEPLIADDDIVDNSMVEVYLDSSVKVINEILRRKLLSSYFELSRELYHACGYPEKLAELPIKFEKPIYGDDNQNLLEVATPGLITILMFGMPLIFAHILMEEKNSGAISRSIVAGTTVLEVLIAHVLVHIGLQILQLLSSMIMMFRILQFPLDNPFLSTLVLFLQGLAGLAVSFSVSASFSHVIALACLNASSVLTIFLLGGLVWPVEGIHSSIKFFSWIVPNTLATRTLRNLTIKGWDFTNKGVYLGFICSSAWIIVFTIITFIYFKRNKAKPFLSKQVC